MSMKTGMSSPTGVWWKPAHRNEKIWFAVAFAWCMVLFAMMPFWHLRGGQNPTGIRARVDPADFRERTNEFIAAYQVGEEEGIPVVEPPPGSDVYLIGQMWQWRPILRLQAGAEYTLHLSSVDVNHGFNLHPVNVNFQVVPGYDYGLSVTPTETGEFEIVCNEFCGVGHHLMVGRIIVVDGETTAESSEASGGDADPSVAAPAATSDGDGDAAQPRVGATTGAATADGDHGAAATAAGSAGGDR